MYGKPSRSMMCNKVSNVDHALNAGGDRRFGLDGFPYTCKDEVWKSCPSCFLAVI